MSIAKINSCALNGLNGYIVNVEIDIASGLPGFDIVGLPDTAVRESKERIRAAIKNTGLTMPPKRITVNLAPADVKKEGAYFDLPIANSHAMNEKPPLHVYDSLNQEKPLELPTNGSFNAVFADITGDGTEDLII